MVFRGSVCFFFFPFFLSFTFILFCNAANRSEKELQQILSWTMKN